MESKNSFVIPPGEIDIAVQMIEPSDLQDLGSKRWLLLHGNFHKIHQQAVLEASDVTEEIVKDKLILNNKIPVIVHEAICTSIWRKYVLQELLKKHPEPRNTFLLLSILYHESTAVALLETILFHEESCESLGDSVIDLIDYCIEAATYSISGDEVDAKTAGEAMKTGADFLNLEEKRLKFDNGIRSISILRCLAEYMNSLMPTAARRMYENDVPILFVELIDNPPWLKKDGNGKKRIYKDGKWHIQEELRGSGDQLMTLDGQVWIGLLFLLLGANCQNHYEITESRKQSLMRVQKHLTEDVMDQLAPLVDLKRWLDHLSISSPPVTSKPVLLEVVPEIREKIFRLYSRKWKKIVKAQEATLLNPVGDDMQDIAKSLSGAYDMSNLATLMQKDIYCANGCGSKGCRRCSRCKQEWYCGRECQVQHWPKHKISCDLQMETN
ncbi:zinc finger MYND domain-containing protein 10 isoform X2 [Ischnura elegans]|uniref:zinc finger MYND domain-containing protein 10 isoform X2 n=1 Tax=Ischnura elegans TaxID=197161 RepID=UPI001ED876B0|nr:zinc finger MYND domain-containing protein 10 isoform X2 [Ischnura elegans]